MEGTGKFALTKGAEFSTVVEDGCWARRTNERAAPGGTRYRRAPRPKRDDTRGGSIIQVHKAVASSLHDISVTNRGHIVGRAQLNDALTAASRIPRCVIIA